MYTIKFNNKSSFEYILNQSSMNLKNSFKALENLFNFTNNKYFIDESNSGINMCSKLASRSRSDKCFKNVNICFTLLRVIYKVQNIKNVIVNALEPYNEKKSCPKY